MTADRPSDLRSEVFFRQDALGNWEYSAPTAIGSVPRLFGASERSYVNRAIAFFRHTAGIPTDREPPVAP